MKLYLMYLLIIIITILFLIIIKDKEKALRLTGILTIFSSILMTSLICIIKIIISISVTGINISVITNYLFNKFLYNSLIIFIIGLIEILFSKFLHRRKIPQNNKNI